MALLNGLRALERGVAAVLLALLVLLVIVGSALRYLGYPVVWSIELAQSLFIWVSVLAADITLQRSGHFSIDMVVGRLPPGPRKAFDVLNLLIVVALLSTLVYFGIKFALVTAGRPMPIIGVSQAFETAALPIGFGLMLITTLEHLHARLTGRTIAPDGDDLREVM